MKKALSEDEIKYLDAGYVVEESLRRALTSYRIISSFKNNAPEMLASDYGYFHKEIRGYKWHEQISIGKIFMTRMSSKYDDWSKETALLLVGIAIEDAEYHLEKTMQMKKRDVYKNFVRHYECVDEVFLLYNVLKHNAGIIKKNLDKSDTSAGNLVKNYGYNAGHIFETKEFTPEEAVINIYVYLYDLICHLFGKYPTKTIDRKRILSTLNYFHAAS